MPQRNDLLIIDVQNDFCHKQGNLRVPGADSDADRLGAFITKNMRRIDDVHFTLDSHEEMAIFHPVYWIDSNGKHPSPFTVIGHKDVMSGKFRPTLAHLADWAAYYTKTLEDQKSDPLVIWPPHCRIGHTEKKPVLGSAGNTVKDPVTGAALTYDFCGWAIYESVSSALSQWALTRNRIIDFVVKGANPNTEHYGAVQAEVIDPKDVTTQVNSRFINTMGIADRIYFAGQALSHCVRKTFEQIAKQFGNDNIKKFTILIDCCSNVPSFEKNGDTFVNEYRNLGMQVAKSTEVTL